MKTPAKHSGDDVFTRNLILEITLNNNKQIIQLMTMRAHVLLTLGGNDGDVADADDDD